MGLSFVAGVRSMNRDVLRSIINRTDARLARYSFGFRPIVVPWEANTNSPPALTPLTQEQAGEGAAPTPSDAAPVCLDVMI